MLSMTVEIDRTSVNLNEVTMKHNSQQIRWGNLSKTTDKAGSNFPDSKD